MSEQLQAFTTVMIYGISAFLLFVIVGGRLNKALNKRRR